jgi:hypothetical protein
VIRKAPEARADSAELLRRGRNASNRLRFILIDAVRVVFG